MDEKMDSEARLVAIQKLKELMKQLDLEQFAPKSLKVQEVEIEKPEDGDLGDDEELAKILGE